MKLSADDHRDWSAFAEASPFARDYTPATVLATDNFSATGAFAARFPLLTELLSSSRWTTFETSHGKRELFAWTASNDQIVGWLCYPPGTPPAKLELHADHQLLLSCFGGICGYWNDPESLVNNQYSALDIEQAKLGVSESSAELFHETVSDYGGDLHLREYVVFATEANSDFFMYHRKTAAVLLVGYDTGRTNVTPLPGYGEFVYTFNGAADLQSWIELLAQEYLSVLTPK